MFLNELDIHDQETGSSYICIIICTMIKHRFLNVINIFPVKYLISNVFTFLIKLSTLKFVLW